MHSSSSCHATKRMAAAKHYQANAHTDNHDEPTKRKCPDAAAADNDNHDDDDDEASSSSSSESECPRYRPPGYVGAVAMHDERDWDGTLLGALPRDVRQMVLDWLWPRQENYMIKFVRETRYFQSNNFKAYVFRSACAAHLLPSFDLLWRATNANAEGYTEINVRSQKNLLYAADFYATAALLYSPEQRWIVRNNKQRSRDPLPYDHVYPRETLGTCIKRKCYINGGDLVMKRYACDRKLFLRCHSLLLRLPTSQDIKHKEEDD
jgi:hypothetical protein